MFAESKSPEMRGWRSATALRLWDTGELFRENRERLLHLIVAKKARSFRELQRALRLPVRLTLFLLSHCGQPSLASLGNEEATGTRECCLLGRTIVPTAYWAGRSRRLPPALLLGQRFITAESVEQRVRLISRVANNHGERIVFLGDDDLASLWLASVNPKLQIVVIELDDAVASVVRKVAAEYKLRICVFERDLRDGPFEDLSHSFDVFVADPYPTADASFEVMFLKTGFDLIGWAGAGIVTWAPTHKAPGFRQIILRVLGKMGCTWQHVRDLGCEYEMLEGELTQAENQQWQHYDRERTAFSHSKEYLILEPSCRPGGSDLDATTTLDNWVVNVLKHDLAGRLDGDDDVLRVPRVGAWSRVSNRWRGFSFVDPTAVLTDLLGSRERAERIAGYLAQGDVGRAKAVAKEQTGLEELYREMEMLGWAVSKGPRARFDGPSARFELYLIARLYESYYRPVSLLDRRSILI